MSKQAIFTSSDDGQNDDDSFEREESGYVDSFRDATRDGK